MNHNFQTYDEIAEDIWSPIDEDIPAKVRLELYKSKLTYINHIQKEIFTELNKQQNLQASESLVKLKMAGEIVRSFLHDVSLEIIQENFKNIKTFPIEKKDLASFGIFQ